MHFSRRKKMLNHALLIDVAFSSFKSLMLILRSTLSLVFSSLLLVVLVVEQLELSHYHQSRLLLLPTYYLSRACMTSQKNVGRLDDFSKISKKIKQRVALAGVDGAP